MLVSKCAPREQQVKFNASNMINPLDGPLVGPVADPLVGSLVDSLVGSVAGPVAGSVAGVVAAKWGENGTMESGTGRVNMVLVYTRMYLFCMRLHTGVYVSIGDVL